MKPRFPDDADGDALRRVADSGADFSRPMRIDFAIAVPSIHHANEIASVVSKHGYEPDVHVDEETKSVSVYCARTMLATYDGVVSVQEHLNELAAPFEGECDGWGTWGNTQGR